MAHVPLLFLALTLDILEGVGPLERVEDPVEVPAEGPLVGPLDGGRHRAPRGPVADGGGPAAVVRHYQRPCPGTRETTLKFRISSNKRRSMITSHESE